MGRKKNDPESFESKKVFFSKCNIYLCNVFFTLWILSKGFTIHKYIPAYFWYYVLHFSTKISISIEEKCNFTDIFLKEIFLKKIYPHNLKIFFFFLGTYLQHFEIKNDRLQRFWYSVIHMRQRVRFFRLGNALQNNFNFIDACFSIKWTFSGYSFGFECLEKFERKYQVYKLYKNIKTFFM